MAKYSELKAGMKVKALGGFKCLHPESVHDVHEDPNGARFIVCEYGKHYLDDQIDFDKLAGFELVKEDGNDKEG